MNIAKCITKLKSNASSGPDGVVTRCYKYGGHFLEEALIDIFNHSIEVGESPSNTKKAWINPTWKGKDKTKAVNYRPIALTNQLSKVIETEFKDRILLHMEAVGMFDDSQHGSTKGRSTVSQLLDQQYTILEMLEDGDNE